MRLRPLFAALFLAASLCMGAEPPHVVVVPFTGDTEAVNEQYRFIVVGHVRATGWVPHTFSAPAGVAAPLPDKPPPREFTGPYTYAITGRVHRLSGEGKSLQIWLWNMDKNAALFTNEIPITDAEGVAGFTLIVQALFFASPAAASEEGTVPAPAPVWDRQLFSLGLRLGGGLGIYPASSQMRLIESIHWSFSAEAGLEAAFQLLPWFSLGTGASIALDMPSIVQWETAYSSGGTLSQVKIGAAAFRAVSLRFPLMARINFDAGGFRFFPALGVYYILPLGDLAYQSPGGSGETLLDYAYTLPLGIAAAFRAGIRGPWNSMLFIEACFAWDLGELYLPGQSGPGGAADPRLFSRRALTLSAGWEFGLTGKP